MSEYTKYLRLMKPQGNEYYNIENFNHNAELIDKETEKLNTAVTKIQEGATREKAGIVQFGTEEGKALEGMMLARLAGCVGYGGDIQTAGVKDINYIYYDRNTRKMYKCLNQNSDMSANVANFIPLDNNSLLDRLENLITFTSNGSYQNTFNGNLSNIGIFTYQSSSSVDTGNKIHMKYIAPQGYEILTASVFWKDNIQETDYIGFDYERTNTEITVVYSTNKMSRSYTVTLFCKKLN